MKKLLTKLARVFSKRKTVSTIADDNQRSSIKADEMDIGIERHQWEDHTHKRSVTEIVVYQGQLYLRGLFIIKNNDRINDPQKH